MLACMSKTTKRSAVRAVTKLQAEELVREQASSGLSMAAFARSLGIPAHRLYEARNRLRRGPASSTREDFVPLHVAHDGEAVGEPVELRLPSGLSIRVERHFDEVALRRLLGVLVSC